MLAAQSHFSIGQSTLTVERLIAEAVKVGAKTVALTDTMSVTGLIDFTNRAKKAGVQPIIGCRLTLVDHAGLAWKKTREDKKGPVEYGLVAYVLSPAGLEALFRLLSIANDEEHFYHHARLSFDDLIAELATLAPDSLAIASGDAYSAVRHAEAPAIFSRIIAAVGASNAFFTLNPIDTPYWDAMNVATIEVANAIGPAAQFLVTRPVHYANLAPAEPGAKAVADPADSTEIIGAICNNRKLMDGWHPRNMVRDFAARSEPAMIADVKAAATRLKTQRGISAGAALIEGLQNTEALAARITWAWSKAPVSLPVMAPDEFKAVVAACLVGWKKRFAAPVFGHRPSDEELATVYRTRLTYELSVLKNLKFSGYFLLVEDVVRWAKAQGILVGPGRGSVGGSLVAYLMEITDCDPIRFGLMFERFINPERQDLPDADLDFMSARRGEVVDYLINKYGQARVAGISNFGTLGPASAIRDVSKAYGMHEEMFACSKFTPKKHGAHVPLAEAADLVPEIGKFRDAFGDVWNHCTALEGVMRNLGRHAAGVVVGGCDLIERAVVERRKDGNTICWDKRIVEDQGLVKMDILGLSTLDLIDQAKTYIFERHGKRVDLLTIPLDDPNILDAFAHALTTGVFQMEGGGMRRLLRNLGKDGMMTFEDVTAATALYRPGPMESGMMDSYWRRKAGEETIEYDHPLMETVLNLTYGVIVYQEQVMKISQVIAGYSGPAADKLRKIMGKKLPEEMKKERATFVNGCVATIKCDAEWAGKLFDKIEGFAGYGFNRSHSIEYSLITYQCMWLKAYYPIEFIAAALSIMDEKRLPALLKDADKLKIELMMPDINLSTDRFEILTDTKICIPFSRIKGVSSNTTKVILDARATVGRFESRKHFDATLTALKVKGKCNVRVTDFIDKVGAFASVEPDQIMARHPDRVRDQRELIPGLIMDIVPIDRTMPTDKATLEALIGIVSAYKELYGPKGAGEMEEFGMTGPALGVPTKPAWSRKQKVMVILDAPTRDEEGKTMGCGDGFAWNTIEQAMDAAGLSPKDCYITALLKTPKSGKQPTAAEITAWAPVLAAEIDLLKPPAIVLMGSAVVRHFIPDFKGKASEEAGKIVYDKRIDANLVIGFGAGECYFDSEKVTLVQDVFEAAFSLIS